MSALAARQLPDGGWGFATDSAVSSALDTALSLRALAGTRALSAKALTAALARLAALEHPGGGFSRTMGEAADLATSAEVLLALGEIGSLTNVESRKAALAGFLAAGINGDGGFPAWPGEPSDVTTTALVLNALLGSGVSLANVTAARDHLRAAQAADGSWLGDPYTTALALKVVGAERADLIVDSLQIAPLSVEQGTPAVATVVVKNGGLAAAAASELALFAGDPSGPATLLGTAQIAPLAVGATATQSFPVATAGFSGAVALHAVADRAGVIVEYSELNNRRIAVLDVRPPGSGAPPAGNQPPVITSVPQSTALRAQIFTYQVDAFDPEGGVLAYGVIADSTLGIAVDAETGLVTWTPPATGLINAALTVRDPEGAVTTQRLSVTVIAPDTKLPPKFDSEPGTPARPGALYSYVAVVHDPDGEPVTLTLAQKPAGMTFDAAAGAISWTPAETDVGEHAVRLVAVDDDGTATEQAWLVVVSKQEQNAIDLTVVAVDVDEALLDPQTLAARGSVRVKVANQGQAPATNVAVIVAEDRDGNQAISASDNSLGAARVASLGGGETAEIVVPLTGKALFRDNRLWAAIDLDGAIPEIREDNNDAPSGGDARLVTVQGAFAPTLKLNWKGANDQEFNQIMVAPMVGYLDDSNGDGREGPGDLPHIVFTTQQTNVVPATVPAKLRAINPRTGAITLQSAENLRPSMSPNIVDLDNDGRPEIVLMNSNQEVIAFNRDGTVRWRSEQIVLSGIQDPTGVAAADLDGDGKTEIIIGNRVLNADGTTRCRGLRNLAGPANVVVEDLDRDGVPEFLAGNIAFRANCAEFWNQPVLQSAQYFVATGQLRPLPGGGLQHPIPSRRRWSNTMARRSGPSPGRPTNGARSRRTGTLTVETIDANRAVVATVVNGHALVLSGASSRAVSAAFLVGLTPAGNYAARAAVPRSLNASERRGSGAAKRGNRRLRFAD